MTATKRPLRNEKTFYLACVLIYLLIGIVVATIYAVNIEAATIGEITSGDVVKAVLVVPLWPLLVIQYLVFEAMNWMVNP
jgi:hypothetical protein